MKYFLIEKNDKTGEELSRIEYSSLRQMARDLKTTYCSCYANFLLNEDQYNTKPVSYTHLTLPTILRV